MTASPSPEWLRRQEIIEHRAPGKRWPWCRQADGYCPAGTYRADPHVCTLDRGHHGPHWCACCRRHWSVHR